MVISGKIEPNFRHGLLMELVHGILRGVGSLKEGQLSQLSCRIDPEEFAHLPHSVAWIGTVQLELQVQALGDHYLVTLKPLTAQVRGPCSSCGRELMQPVKAADEQLSFVKELVPTGQIDLRPFLQDWLSSLVAESLPCQKEPCQWREEIDQLIDRATQEKRAQPFHPFRALLSETSEQCHRSN